MAGHRREVVEAWQSEALRRIGLGESTKSVAQALGRAVVSVNRVLVRTAGFVPKPRTRSPLRLSLAEREEISRGLESGASCRAIAIRLRRAPSTVSREVCRQGGASGYRAWAADVAALRLARRPKRPKLLRHRRLRALVERFLKRHWSPEQIAQRLVRDYPDEPEMRVSHETIYRSLYVQSRGALRHELTRFLRSERTRRHPRRRDTVPGIHDMVLISQRPAEVGDRAVPGHWEGDLLLGTGGHSAIGTLVERRTRLTLLLALPHGRTAEQVRRALTRASAPCPRSCAAR
jgi:IS30 family transposase